MELTGVLPILLSLGAALVWGVADFAGGLGTRKTSVYRLTWLAELVGILAMLPLVFIFGESLPPPAQLLPAAVAGVCGVSGMLLLFQALAQGQMSVAAPVSALLGAAIPVLWGSWLEGFPGWLKLLGFALALFAISLISAAADAAAGSAARRLHFHSLRLPLLAGVAFGFYFVLLNAAGKEAVFVPVILARLVSTILLTLFLLWTRQPFLPHPPARKLALLNGVLDASANALYILAGRTGRLDIAAVLSSLFPGATVVMAWIILKERLSRSQWLGVLLALLAIVLIAA